jgi:hypothetical protein
MTTRLMAICLITFGLLSACQSSPPDLTPVLQEITVEPVVNGDAIRTAKGLNWNEAKSWAGEFKVVCGPVVDTAYASGSSGKPTFLNIGRSYPDPERFTVVIWDGNRANFPRQPENYYLGKDICVDGLIELYKGGAQIEGKTQDQIDIQ